MKILMVQNTVRKYIKDTILEINQMLEKIDFDKVDFIVFPEMFTTPYEHKYFQLYKQSQNDEVNEFLSDLAKKTNAYIIGGSIPEYNDGKIYNTSNVFDRKGNLIAKYQKIHLFSVEYPNGESFSEKEILSQGEDIVTFETEFGIMGVMICFDIRFPEQAELLREKGAKIIFVPAAFNTFTGPLHWEVTFRARAIDNQLFIIGVSPSRESFGSYNTYGHSLAVDPYGKIIKKLSEKSGLIEVEIDLDLIEEARNKIPIIKNKVRI